MRTVELAGRAVGPGQPCFLIAEAGVNHNGDPRLAGCVGWIDCTVHNVHAEGDHYIVVGKVLDLVEGEAAEPLLFYRSGYRKLD